MLREVQPLDFVVLGNTKTDYHVNDLQDDQRAGGGQYPGDHHANQLVQKLMCVALPNAGNQRVSLSIFKNRVDTAGGRDSGQQPANVASAAMHAELGQAIVISEACFYF